MLAQGCLLFGKPVKSILGKPVKFKELEIGKIISLRIIDEKTGQVEIQIEVHKNKIKKVESLLFKDIHISCGD